MRLTVVVESEAGEPLEQVDDPNRVIARLLPSTENTAYPCLWGIDLYGNTVFNGIQAPQFLREWKRISAGAVGPEERALVAAVEAMAGKVAQGPRLYLKFYGG